MEKEDEETFLRQLWDSKDLQTAEGTNDELLELFKQGIITGPVLRRPDFNRRFFLKTDWSKDAMGSGILQSEQSEKAEEALMAEINGGKCEFDKTVNGLRLRPIAFISRRCTGRERDYHSHVGETVAGKWAMDRFKHWLLGREFTWITDCSGILKFFEMGHEATHTMQRWKMEMLRFNFTIVHRPGKMLAECDLLSRYNIWTDEWRHAKPNITSTPDPTSKTLMTRIQHDMQTEQPNKTHNIPRSFFHPHVVGPIDGDRTPLATKCDQGKTMIIIGAGGQPIEEAMINIGLTPLIIDQTDEAPYWQQLEDLPNLERFEKRLHANPMKTAE